MTHKRVIDGVTLPGDGSLTENEMAWVEFIRLLSGGSDPAPTLVGINVLRQALGCGRSSSG